MSERSPLAATFRGTAALALTATILAAAHGAWRGTGALAGMADAMHFGGTIVLLALALFAATFVALTAAGLFASIAGELLKERNPAIAAAAEAILALDLTARDGRPKRAVVEVSREILADPEKHGAMRPETRDALSRALPWWHGILYDGVEATIEPPPRSATLRATVERDFAAFHRKRGGKP